MSIADKPYKGGDHDTTPDSAEEIVLGAWSALLGLLRVEVEQGVKQVPGIILISLIKIPCLLLLWVSFTMLCMWSAYIATNTVFVALLVSFLLQLILLLVFERIGSKKMYRASIPLTRYYFNQLINPERRHCDYSTEAVSAKKESTI